MKYKLPGFLIWTTLISCLSFSSYAQSTLSFKIYQNTDIFETRLFDSGHWTTEGNLHFGRISLAVDLLTKKAFAHEVEFLIPEFSRPIEKLQFPMYYAFFNGDKPEGEAASYSLRYEIHKVMADKSDRFDFLFGVGINPYYVHMEYTPPSSNAYYTSKTFYGFALNVTPGLYYKLNRLFSIDLNAPIRMYNFQGETYRQDNPILTTRQQRRHGINHLVFEPVYTVRLGLRYSLYK